MKHESDESIFNLMYKSYFLKDFSTRFDFFVFKKNVPIVQLKECIHRKKNGMKHEPDENIFNLMFKSYFLKDFSTRFDFLVFKKMYQ